TSSGVIREASNLLPNDAEWVAEVDVEKFRNTPAGSAVFDPSKQIVSLFKEHLGIPITDIDRVFGSGGGGGGWSFTVGKSKNSIKEDALRAAAQRGAPIGPLPNQHYA